MAPPESDSLTTTNSSILQKTFTANTFAPLLLTQSLLPSLLLSPSPRIGLMSSLVGSISENNTGGSYAYRASKAALNSIGKSMAMDLKEKGVVVVLMHPGDGKTGSDTNGKMDLVKAAIETEEAAEKLWRVMRTKGLEETGGFWHREGYKLDW